jgi:hypothetical protein
MEGAAPILPGRTPFTRTPCIAARFAKLFVRLGPLVWMRDRPPAFHSAHMPGWKWC